MGHQPVTGGHTYYFGYNLNSSLAWELQDATVYRGEIYGGKGKVATYKAGLTFFPTTDLVGTVRNNVTQDGAVSESCASLPYGDGQSCWGNGAGTPGPAFFTGEDRDAESNLDHFWFRGYSSNEGRWTTPDPAGLAAVDVTNPQSWNRYAYVMNNPLSFVDPLGLKYCVTGGDTTVAGDTGIPCGGAAGGGGGGGDGDGTACFDGDPNCTVVSGSGFNFGFGFNGGLGGPCGESLGIPCGLPSLPSPGLLDILGLSPQSNCQPICDATNAPTQQQQDALKEQQCEQQSQAAFGPFFTEESIVSTLFGGSIGYWILGKSFLAVGQGIAVSQLAQFDAKAMNYNATLQACRQANGIGGMTGAIQFTP